MSFAGRHFRVERAKLYDLPGTPPPIGIAASGPYSVKLAAEHADSLIAVQPDHDLVSEFDAATGSSKPKYGQLRSVTTATSGRPVGVPASCGAGLSPAGT